MSTERAEVAPPVRYPEGQASLVLIVAGLYVLRIFILPWLGLFNDEAYYWEWSRRLALSYYDHPPLVAYLLRVSTALFGDTQGGVHLPALILSALTSVVLFRLVLDLFPGNRPLAWWSVLAVQSMPLFALGAVFTTPDAPCALVWLLTLRFVWSAHGGRARHWYLAGLCGALGILSKYVFVLSLVGVLAFLLSSPSSRTWLRRREPYLGVAIMALGAVPILIWNARHDWASFSFHLIERHHGRFHPLANVGRLLTAQLAASPLLFAACLVGGWRSYERARSGDEVHRFLLCSSMGILGFFAIVGVLTPVNPNWFIFGYSTLAISACAAMLEAKRRLLRAWVVGSGLVSGALFYLQALTLAVPIPPSTDFATDLNGWSTIGRKVDELRGTMPRPERTFVLTPRFQLSALVAFYGSHEATVTRLGGRRDQYDYWRSEAQLPGEDAIVLTDDRSRVDPVSDYPFARCEQSPDLNLAFHGRSYRSIHLWRCSNYLSSVKLQETSPQGPPLAPSAARL
jgi:4-amino-4-deoxy-L-arabinose transferase-like glycosyltransferase